MLACLGGPQASRRGRGGIPSCMPGEQLPARMLFLLLASLLGSRLAEHAQSAARLRSVRQLSRTATDDRSGFVPTIYARAGVDLAVLHALRRENCVSKLHRSRQPRRAL